MNQQQATAALIAGITAQAVGDQATADKIGAELIESGYAEPVDVDECDDGSHFVKLIDETNEQGRRVMLEREGMLYRVTFVSAPHIDPDREVLTAYYGMEKDRAQIVWDHWFNRESEEF